MARELTPYDTGARLEPVPWVTSDGRVARENHRRAQPGDYGKVDFNGKVDLTDDASDTIATVYVERTPEGQYVLHLEEWGGHEVKVVRL